MNVLNVSDLVQALGGTVKTAALVGTKPSAVSNWKAANRFPDRASLHQRIRELAVQRGINLPADFFETSSPSHSEARDGSDGNLKTAGKVAAE